MIALTFDDGPDPRWTPAILDILKQENVPATFFIIGKNGQAYPDLMRRIVNEGHEIGNHTFTHPNLGEIPASLTELELNATQRLIESELAGRPSCFVRHILVTPKPTSRRKLSRHTRRRTSAIWWSVCVSIRSDWKLPVSADEIVKRTIDRASDHNPETRGEIVLLHDSGGDRAATVRGVAGTDSSVARARLSAGSSFRFGWTFSRSSDAGDPANQRVFTRADAIAFFFLSTSGWTLQWIYVIGIVLGLGRLVFIGALAFAQWMRRDDANAACGRALPAFCFRVGPGVTTKSWSFETRFDSLLASDYENYEMIFVDDGSTDQTSEVVRESFSRDERVKPFSVSERRKSGGA